MWKIVPVKAIRIHEDGGPEVLRYEDAPDPVPGKGQVLVELRAASLNHLDVWIRKGLPSVAKPRILGADGSGIVVSGDGFAQGDRVVINPGLDHGDGRVTVIGEHTDGTHAELIAVQRSQVYPIPDGLDFEAAASFPLVFETAYRMLATKAALEPGEWVLVWGIGGGVATASLAIAKALGEATWQRSLAAARSAGRICVCGATSGPNPPAQLHRIWWKQLTIFGSTMGSREDFEAVYDLVASGEVVPVVDAVFPLAEAAAAHARLEAGEQLGKVVLRIPG